MKLKAFLVAATLLLQTFTGVSALADTSTGEKRTLYFCENFDSARGELVKSMEFSPRNNEITITKTDDKSADKRACITMKSTEEESKDAAIIKRFNESCPAGDVIIEASVMFENIGGCSPKIALRSLKSGGNEIYPVEVTQNGQILGIGGVELLSSVVEGKPYKIALAFNFDSGTYDAYINGLRRAKKIPFRNHISYGFDEISLILFNVTRPTPGCRTKYYVDDIKVYKGKNPLSDESFENRNWEPVLDYNTPVSTEMIRFGMQNNIVLYIGADKALLNGRAESIDPLNENVVPYIENGSTLVPARFLIEALGGEVSYDSKKHSASADVCGKNVVLTADSKYMLVNGEKVDLDTPAAIQNGRFFVPLRAIGELLGKKVFWDKTGLIILSDEEVNLNWRSNTSYLSAIAGEMVYKRPQGDDVLRAMKERFPNQAHPRILADGNTFSELREEIKTNSVKAKWYAEIKERADAYLTKKVIEFPKSLQSLTDQGTNFKTMAPYLAFVYNMENDMKYAQRLIDEIQAWIDYEYWTPYSMLGLGRALNGFAFAYDWLYDVMPQQLKTDLKKAIKERVYSEVFKDYYNIYPRSRSFEWTLSKVGDNWNTTINSGVIMTAIAFGDEEGCEEECGQLITEALISLESAFNQLAPDGSWYEGVGYWTPTAEGMIWAMETLRNASGSDYGLFNVPGMKYAGYYLFEMSSQTGIFNYNFANYRGYPRPILIYFADRLGDDSLKQLCIDHYEKYRGESGTYMTADALILSGDIPDERVDVKLPLDAYYRGTEAVSMRSSWEKGKEFYAGIHSGFNGAPNAQLDIGTFVVEAFGERFITDFGPENYDLTPYIFEAYMNRAEGANCYIINPSTDYFDQLKSAYCYFDRFESNDISALAITDTSAAYGDKVKSAVRGMKMTNDRTCVVLQDEIVCTAPSDVYWGMHTPAEVTLSEDKKTAILDIRGNKMEVKIMSEQGEFSCDKPVALPECFQLAGQTEHPGVTKLAMRFKDAKELNLSLCFTPLGYASGVDVKYPEIKKLSDWTLDKPGETEKTIIPDVSDVVLKDLKIDGVSVPDFSPDKATINYTIESRTSPMPKVEAFSDYETEVVYPDTWPANIKVVLKHENATIEKEIVISAPPQTKLDYSHNELKVIAASVDVLTQEDAPPENSLDHNFETRLALAVPNFVIYDFGEVKPVDKVLLAFYSGNRRKAIFDIEVSEDNINWTQVFSGESSGKTLDYEYFDIGSQKARYLKIVGHGADTKENWLSITEFRAFGAK